MFDVAALHFVECMIGIIVVVILVVTAKTRLTVMEGLSGNSAVQSWLQAQKVGTLLYDLLDEHFLLLGLTILKK